MNDIENIRTGLLTFITVDKFVEYGYLQPAVKNSTEETKKFVNNDINACCSKLLQKLDQGYSSDQELKEVVREFLDKFEYLKLDTEDREFCFELYHKIGEILGIDIEDTSMTIEQKLRHDLERLAKNAGLNLSDFLPPDAEV